ncbi:MAG: hypothetical protein ACRDKW_18870, partial [Actinomycetota bacterium]
MRREGSGVVTPEAPTTDPGRPGLRLGRGRRAPGIRVERLRNRNRRRRRRELGGVALTTAVLGVALVAAALV